MVIIPTCHGDLLQLLYFSLCFVFGNSNNALLCFTRALHKPCPVPTPSEERHTLKCGRFYTRSGFLGRAGNYHVEYNFENTFSNPNVVL